MAVDENTVRHIAKLARIAVSGQEVTALQGELSEILAWVEQLDEVDTSGVEPMTSVVRTEMKKRDDAVTDGNRAGDIVGNAPASEDSYFVVPKVVE
ncbi:Asp-tRNA(Asn)/Glu-tRNA(Gln) amidotransferase subunit GatC [Kaustia mangrovi]|uniref:Aspartyl/glutamyl-tRNA(Asn/Gln) amidotransferase subunit C n=1 Tax=Kaustia mangrovi TaxID=2593653 RepID=A0A7S8C1D8_9HYPH|nr:Asp-tRNA(Asn)/Glu-tRNA(Gln) amidotransferase subunit GatC [Kaustia mangrovi]QPC41600.1 Asp-tRNA(Asn)/Glu-tRNA(Gln) amidotransferase subunit GatC [Kaustia mangrovi]